MGNLPRERVTPAPPFHVTGVDYAGPIMLKDRKGRGAKIRKSYICLFVCFTVKAVHIELVGDLTTESFIAAFRRFCARRGKPGQVYSDNGTNFVGARKELRDLAKFLLENNGKIAESLNDLGVEWSFVPAFSPHFGGLWEAGIKSTKGHLRRVLKNSILTFEETLTILTEIEAILNSRPIIPLSNDPNDLTALTPSHFLIGRPITSLPDPELTDIRQNQLSRFQMLQQLQQHFWKRWAREFITELQVRTKWKTSQGELKPGSLVVIKEDHLPPLKWMLGRIVQLHPGTDGVARVASIQTTKGLVKRSFPRICMLPEENNSDV